MKLSEFDFKLPKILIAQTPVETRNQSRLMVVDRISGDITHCIFNDLPKYLINRPLITLNNTRVIPAKLIGIMKETGKAIELLLIREERPMLWEALIKGLTKIKPGQEIVFKNTNMTATMVERRDDRGLLQFGPGSSITEFLENVGQLPLPQYIHRENPNSLSNMDRERYQTVYSMHTGAIAAPTAGLHFTSEMLEEIEKNHADIEQITLHVGPGTFQPVRCEDIENHKMASEEFRISSETWNKIYQAKVNGQKILAVGTTSTRVLESLKFESMEKEEVTGFTDRFIYPGQKFNTVDHLLTNFHLPKSTLFMLVCAFGGKDLMTKAYHEAIQSEYRFFSYGDAMLIL
ncbi:MAG: tRNA preQ1(34) S-adenosylmethionine ribosyltransferase-isomerase QueA [Nitrospinales bacterium]